MSRRLFPLLALLALAVSACGGGTGPSATSPAGSPAAAGGSPAPLTPTAQEAKPASPSPAPSPSPAASPSPSPVAAAPASPEPAGAGASGAGAAGGVVYRIVPEQSEAAYRAREKFVERPFPNDAVGTTKDVSGEIELERAGVLRGRVRMMRVDLRTLTSDSPRRDNFIRQNTLQTDRFPFAEFNSSEPAGPPSYAEGDEASFRLPGMMTIRGQDRPITWDVTARLVGNSITGAATARVKLSDYGVEAPRLAILTVEDEMTWEVKLTAERAP